MCETQYTLRQLGWKTTFNQQLSLEDLEQTTPHRVTQVFRNRLVLLGEKGEMHIDLAQYPVLQNATVGDWLLVPNDAANTPKLLERQSQFKRKAPGTHDYQMIAANIDTAFIVSSCNHDFNLSRIERYLALAKDAQVNVVLVLTKSDQVNHEQRQIYLDQLHDLLNHLVVLTVNALDNNDCQKLSDWCHEGQTVALLGSSGVGKTTLTNTLCSEYQPTAGIREDDSKGRHTTTSRALYFARAGGLILDSPGMRELQLTDCEEGVKAAFDDIEQLAKLCKFADCGHQSEPECAVQKAIDEGQLAPRRWVNYQKMLSEQARNTMTLAESHKKDREFGRLIKSTLKLKKKRFE